MHLNFTQNYSAPSTLQNTRPDAIVAQPVAVAIFGMGMRRERTAPSLVSHT